MPPNHILWVTSRPKSPEREEEFDTWHNNYYLQQVLKVPGVVAATRYKLSRLQMEWFPPSAVTPTWPYGKEFTHVTIFEIDFDADPRTVFADLRATEASRQTLDPDNDPVEWGEQWFYEAFTEREVSIWPRPGGAELSKPTAEPNHIFIVPISPLSPELEDDFNRWYISQGNIRRPGIAAGVRYRLSELQEPIDSRAPRVQGEWPFGQHSYLMIYELSDPIAAYNDLRNSVMQSQAAAAAGRPAGGGRFSWLKPWGSLRKVDEHIVYDPITCRVTPLFLKRD